MQSLESKKGCQPFCVTKQEREDLLAENRFFVDYFMDDEGEFKQVWDGSKGMLSLFAIPNRFGLFRADPPLSAISVLRDDSKCIK
jgi:hypothetical protein